MSGAPQTMFVAEYPCDKFCHIEIDLSGEPGQVTLSHMREKAEALHRLEHEPEGAATDATDAAGQAPAGLPAATVFLSAPGQSASGPPASGRRNSGRQGQGQRRR